jgi:serine/threonine protein kinase
MLDDLKHLLESMLVYDPQARVTIEEVMMSEWIKSLTTTVKVATR